MDDQVPISALKTLVFYTKAKHIAIKFHWLRQDVIARQIKYLAAHHLRSEDMVAHITTKDVVAKVWNELYDHLMGKINITSEVMIKPQSRPQGEEFPV